MRDRVIEGLDPRRVPGHRDIVRLGEAAEPFEIADRRLQAALAGRLEDQQRLARDREKGAVLRRHHGGVVDCQQAAGARLIDRR